MTDMCDRCEEMMTSDETERAIEDWTQTATERLKGSTENIHQIISCSQINQSSVRNMIGYIRNYDDDTFASLKIREQWEIQVVFVTEKNKITYILYFHCIKETPRMRVLKATCPVYTTILLSTRPEDQLYHFRITIIRKERNIRPF